MKEPHGPHPHSRSRLALAPALLGLVAAARPAAAGPPYQATGLKIGEVTDASAIVWTRLTLRPERNPADAPMAEFLYEAGDGGSKERKVTGVRYPEGMTVADIRDAAPGAPGEVRVLHKLSGSTEVHATDWRPVDVERDFTR